jgi:hypothetical protein
MSISAYSTNKNKSLSSVYLPSLMDNKIYSKGYMGYDEFTIIENSLARHFPLYKHFTLYKKGEASWVLKVVNSIDN